MKIGMPLPLGRQVPGTPFPQQNREAPGATSQLSFPQGRLLLASILSVSGDGEALLSVADQTISAKSLTPLTPGQELWLEVVRPGNPPLLGTAAKKGALVELVRLVFSSQSFSSSLMEGAGLLDRLQQLAPTQKNLSQQLIQLAQFLSQGTIGAEADPQKLQKLARILELLSNISTKNQPKEHLTAGQLQKELQEIVGQQAGDSKSLLTQAEGKDVSRLVRLYESFAQVNSQLPAGDQPNFFLFPCFFSNQGGWGEWLFRFTQEEKEGGGSSKQYGLSFFLEMSRVGTLHLKVDVFDDGVQGVFSVESQSVADHVTSCLPELKSILTQHGFQKVQLSCCKANNSHLHCLQEECAALVQADSFVLVDKTV